MKTLLNAARLRTRIGRVLKELGGVSWSVLLQEQQRATLHLTRRGAIETSMEARRTQAEVTLYKRSGTHLGNASFTLFTDDEDVLRDKAEDALLLCREATKEAWPLPGRQRYRAVKTSDDRIATAFKEGKAEQLLERLWKRMLRVPTRGVRVSHAELHLTTTKNHVFNSAGLSGKSDATTLFVEVVMTARKSGEEAEFYRAVTVGRLADFSPTRFLRECAERARDVLKATPFHGVRVGGIALSGEALRDFWAPDLSLNPVVAHANAQAKYRQLSTFEKEARITTNKTFTLISDPFIPYNPASGKFDNEGTASKKLVLVKKGVVKEFFASQRYAHYLGVPPTGALGVLTLSPGKHLRKRLLTDGTIEIVSFSSFVPNSLSGDFSAEIRLGYLHLDGKSIPIKNALFTGNVFRMLDTMRAAKDRVVMEGYAGPSLVRFEEGCHLAGR